MTLRYLVPYTHITHVFDRHTHRHTPTINCTRARCICKTHHTGWWRLIGCLQLQVIFRKRATNHRTLLQKMTYKDKAFYASSPPCRSLLLQIWIAVLQRQRAAMLQHTETHCSTLQHTATHCTSANSSFTASCCRCKSLCCSVIVQM